jgi:hypothetical protein
MGEERMRGYDTPSFVCMCIERWREEEGRRNFIYIWDVDGDDDDDDDM